MSAIEAHTPEQSPPSSDSHAHARSLRQLTLGAIGIVFGDIGTSPLYTFQECIGTRGVTPTPANVIGVLSLIVWSLILVVTVKYLAFLMRADNRGEGGIFALLALVPPKTSQRATNLSWVAILVMVGAALLFGDGIITPAISVLSAVEGLEVATMKFHPYVVPITCAILVGLFSIQSRGTGGIGRLFGPVMVLWFVVIGLLGAWHIARAPQILAALSPFEAVRFFLRHGWRGFTLLGSVVLAVTGGEALYADMGHFGKRPIRVGWLSLVFPSLVLCYLGQGALILRVHGATEAPFFGMVPVGVATYALVAIATPATVIASQALVSGVFSLTHQAVQLGYFPRVLVRHTAGDAEGQIYTPALNWWLAIACIALVLFFQRAERLASAFGLAVSGTMAITSVVFFEVTRTTWRWPLWKSLAVLVGFLSFDLPFVAANVLKFFEGGYIPVLVGAIFCVIMVDWRLGRLALGQYFAEHTAPIDKFLADLPKRGCSRAPGAAVFLASTRVGAPPVLCQLVSRVHAIQQVVVLLTVETEHRPTIPRDERLRVEQLASGFYRVIAHCGFMEVPNIPDWIRQAASEHALPVDVSEVTYYLGRETFIGGRGGQMGPWAETLFAFLSRNSHSASRYFGLPAEQVVEIGAQIDL